MNEEYMGFLTGQQKGAYKYTLIQYNAWLFLLSLFFPQQFQLAIMMCSFSRL